MSMFSSGDERAVAASSLAQAKSMAEKAGAIWEDLDVPTQEQLIDAVKYQEEVRDEQAQEVKNSAINELLQDNSIVDQQKMALAKMGQMSQLGITPEEEMQREILMNNTAGQERSRQKSILQDMQERGVGGSGVEAAVRLQSSQSAANRARTEGQALESEKYKRALEGITSTANLAGQIREQQVQEASAADQIAQFNAQQRSGTNVRNIAKDTDIAKQKTAATQSAYDNEFRRAQEQANAYTGQAQMMSTQGMAQGQAAAAKSAAAMQLAGSAMGAAGTASDVRVKENIEPGKADLEEMYENLDGYKFDYKDPERHGQGKQLGIMAQDLEKSELGQQFVSEDNPDIGLGTKNIDYESMAPTIVAAQAEQHKETKSLKEKVAQLEEMLRTFRGN